MKITVEFESMAEMLEFGDVVSKLRAVTEKDKDKRPIEELGFSFRTENCLKFIGVFTVGDLLEFSENNLIRAPNFGKKSVTEIRDVLACHGLYLSSKGKIA